MINNPRFILTLDGTSTVSPSNNNIINVASTPPATINLGALNSADGPPALISTPTSCQFDVYSINTIFKPDDLNYLCSNGVTDGNGDNVNLPNTDNISGIFSFRDQFIFFNGNGEANVSNTTSNFVAATGTGTGVDAAHCHFVVTDKSCESFDFNGNDENYFQSANGKDVTNPGDNGISFTCIANNVNYGYNNFDVSFENNCYNPSAKSYLVFTPKAGTTGLQELGNGLLSTPFYINNIENQNGDFYLTPGCDATDLSLYTALDDVVISHHTYN